jgi:hypothetical protein
MHVRCPLLQNVKTRTYWVCTCKNKCEMLNRTGSQMLGGSKSNQFGSLEISEHEVNNLDSSLLFLRYLLMYIPAHDSTIPAEDDATRRPNLSLIRGTT